MYVIYNTIAEENIVFYAYKPKKCSYKFLKNAK